MKVTLKLHICKTISYIIIGSLQTIIISYIITDDFLISSSLGVLELCIKPIIYFLHERIWYKYIKIGLKKEL